jgi:outer membrane receptor protein involved in Fe transport
MRKMQKWTPVSCAVHVVILLACGAAGRASAQQSPSESGQLQEITITAQRLSLIGTASTASQGVVVNSELSITPAYRPGQLLETVPGLAVTVHSGEGKANQYLMRGYNLDHGTDIGIWVDDMPVNEPSHAHGQGYADLNFMIPELATNVTYTKGTYYADQGDFSSVGSVHESYVNTIADQATIGAGPDGFRRIFTAASQDLSAGRHLLEAVELQHYDGPWTHPDDQRKLNAVLRLSQGDDHNGYSLTGMIYHDAWNATTDQPQRAVDAGLIGRYGTLDPSDGGYAQRASLSAQYHSMGDGGQQLTVSAYVISNHLTLWNDFTHFLTDPIDGDQEAQHEDRTTIGGDISYALQAGFAGINNDLLVGFHTRTDLSNVSRIPTKDRIPLTQAQLDAVDYPSFMSEIDQIRLNSIAGYVQATTHWTGWLRTVLGVREDYMRGSDAGTNAGSASASLFEPKASVIFRATPSTELYLSWGRGFHSDDLRGVTRAAQAGDAGGAPLIAKQTGEEIGLRQQFGTRVAATLALYSLDAQSEITYDPDAGQDSPGPGSHRRGAEINITYQALRWLEFYGSYSPNRARYTSPYDDGTGHIGYFLPNAPFAMGSFDMYIRNLGRWDGGLEYRYLGNYPLTADDEVQGHGYGEWNLDVHYSLNGGWRLGAGLYNLLNSHADAMQYWYVGRLPGEPARGISGLQVHPLEPFTWRFTVSKTF